MGKILKFIAFIFLLGIIAFFALLLNSGSDEKETRAQIEREYPALNNEIDPILLYLKEYKKTNGRYPEELSPDFVSGSKTFEYYIYNAEDNGAGYSIEVYPVDAPVEFYYNDEYDNGHNRFENDGIYDMFLDNERFYQIDKTWHAVTYDYLSRHNKIFKILSFLFGEN